MFLSEYIIDNAKIFYCLICSHFICEVKSIISVSQSMIISVKKIQITLVMLYSWNY